MEKAVNQVTDISRQLVESKAGQKMDIMLGGGRASFQPESYKELDETMRADAGFDYDDERDIWDNYRRDNRFRLLTDLLMSKLINFYFYFLDTRSLIEEWLAKEDTRRRYITNKTDLAAIDAKTTDQVMGQYQLLHLNFFYFLNSTRRNRSPGIFTNSYVTWDDMLDQKPTVPSIAEMATASVKFLKEKSGPEGFFVMIEVGEDFLNFMMKKNLLVF